MKCCDLGTLRKHPSQTRGFRMDFSRQPEIIEDAQTLTGSPTVTLTGRSGASGASAATITISGTEVRFNVAGGTDGQIYDVTVIVTLSGGGQLVGCGVLEISDCLP